MNIQQLIFVALATIATQILPASSTPNSRPRTPVEVSMDLAADFYADWKAASSPEWRDAIHRIWLMKIEQVASSFKTPPGYSPDFEMDGARLRAAREGFYPDSPLFKALQFASESPHAFAQVSNLRFALGVPDFTNMPSLGLLKVVAKKAATTAASTATAAAPQVPDSKDQKN
jgi:hypothetical protein